MVFSSIVSNFLQSSELRNIVHIGYKQTATPDCATGLWKGKAAKIIVIKKVCKC